MNIINLTPHKITVYPLTDDFAREFLSQGVIRVKTLHQQIQTIQGIPIRRTTYSKTFTLGDREFTEEELISYLSEKYGNACIIVSLPVLQALSSYKFSTPKGTLLFTAPDTSPDSVVRDENGRVIGVKAFTVIY